MGAASTPRPIAAGVAMSTTSRRAQSRVSENDSGDAAACWRDRCGRMTVARAIPNTPRGNSTIRSEKYSHDTLPVTRNDAIIVSTSRLIWETETPNTAGMINEITRVTPSWARRRRGRTIIPSAARNGNWNANWTIPPAEHAPRERDDRDVEHRCEPQRGADQADVEQYRREGRNRESAAGVENASCEGDERDEEQVRKGDTHHLDGERVLHGVGQKPGGEYGDEYRRCDNAGDSDDGEHSDQCPRDMRGQIAHFTDIALRAILAQNGHERLGESAFGEQPAQKIRNSERDEKGIGPGTGAERLGDDDIAHESQYARRHRVCADHSRRFEERLVHRIESRPGTMFRMRREGRKWG